MSDIEKKLDDVETSLSSDGLEEDVARADLYGLLASLFYTPLMMIYCTGLPRQQPMAPVQERQQMLP